MRWNLLPLRQFHDCASHRFHFFSTLIQILWRFCVQDKIQTQSNYLNAFELRRQTISISAEYEIVVYSKTENKSHVFKSSENYLPQIIPLFTENS